MVVQPNMPVVDIINVWPETKHIVQRYDIPVSSTRTLEELLTGNRLTQLLKELNEAIGSSELTCIDGG